MKSTNKTKKELFGEMEALRERLSEMEKNEKKSRQVLGNFGERTNRSFFQTAFMQEAIFVIFDRKYEFVNDRFSELFGVSPDDACSSKFDPMTIIAPESRFFISEQYREWCRSSHTSQQFNYTGLSMDGLKIECETSLLFIPYKWGLAIHGVLRSIPVNRRVDDALQRSRNDLRVVSKAVNFA